MKTNYFKKAIATASIFTLSLGVFGQIIPDGTYVIINNTSETNRVMTLDQSSPFDARVSEADVEGDDLFQQWSLAHQGDNIYRITNLGTNTLLGVNDSWCDNFGNVTSDQNNGSLGVDFEIIQGDTENTFLIQIGFLSTCNQFSDPNTRTSFDVNRDNNPGNSNFEQIQTFSTGTGNTNQQFFITPPAPAAVLSVDEVSLLDFVDVYFSNELGLTIRASDNKKQNLSLEIYDTSGSTVYSKKLGNIDGNELNLNLDSFQPGVYFAKIQNEQNQSKVTKIVVF